MPVTSYIHLPIFRLLSPADYDVGGQLTEMCNNWRPSRSGNDSGVCDRRVYALLPLAASCLAFLFYKLYREQMVCRLLLL